jgi:predicted nucleotidyltransferase
MLMLPVGTQVVARVETKRDASNTRPAGAVGEIVETPVDASHSYLVRFADGGVAALRRHEIAVRKHEQREGIERPESALAEYDLRDFVIYRCVVGSRAFGLDNEASDTDLRGIYLPPARAHWSLYGVPEQLEDKAAEECYWELQKFIVLALKANPNVLECLYTPLVELATPLARRLLDAREMFLSRLVYQTYNGYVLSQFKKLEQDLRTKGEIRWKHAMHLVRLLISGATILEEGYVPVRVDEARDGLLAIRGGGVSWEEIDAWRLELHARFDEALARTRLPERPDYARANDFLVAARREMVDV